MGLIKLSGLVKTHARLVLTLHRGASTQKFADLSELLLQMPREPKHVPALRHTRQQLKERGMRYAPGTITLQVLGGGGGGGASPRSLYIFTDQNRYLFNCGEGTQRLAHEHKMKLAKLEHVFVTYNCWENLGGLPGLALTVQDIGVPQLTLHGPPGLEELFQATRRFVVLKDLQIQQRPHTSHVHFEDNVMRVEYVLLWGERKVDLNNQTQEEEDTTDYYAHERTGRRARFFQENNSASNGQQEVNREERDVSVAYICRPHKKPGALVLEKCVEKGVPAGPLLGKLKAGEDVTLPNGSVVRADEVRMADDPGPIFLVVECPSEAFLDSLIGSVELSRHQNCTSEDEAAYAVVHFTPSHVMQTDRYHRWMSLFPPSTIHLTINEDNVGFGSVAVHRIQHKLNLLHPHIFPLLKEPEDSPQDKKDIGIPLVRGATLLSCHLRPRKGVDDSLIPKLDPQEYIDETMATEGFLDTLEKLKKSISTMEGDPEREFPKLLFLGTGSCIPNKTRNTSGLLLHTEPDKYILMDCGEGTYGQLVRFYGQAESRNVLHCLQAIYVSHLHADHHIGLISLLKARRKTCPSTTLLLLAPKQITSWLGRYHRVFEHIMADIRIIPNDAGTPPDVLDKMGMSDICTTPVEHCPNAFGICLTHREGWSLVYSGDTMPCEGLVEIGKGCDLLVHEATMEDGLEEEAKLKTHSTTSQAIEQGRNMQAGFTILTHFSQRYAKLPLINHNFGQAVGIAFDNMIVRLSDLKLIPLMYPALKLMFAEHYEEMEQKTAKKIMKAEREKVERARKASV